MCRWYFVVLGVSPGDLSLTKADSIILKHMGDDSNNIYTIFLTIIFACLDTYPAEHWGNLTSPLPLFRC